MELPNEHITSDLAQLLQSRMRDQPLQLHDAVRGLLIELQGLDTQLENEHVALGASLRRAVAEMHAEETAIGGTDVFEQLMLVEPGEYAS